MHARLHKSGILIDHASQGALPFSYLFYKHNKCESSFPAMQWSTDAESDMAHMWAAVVTAAAAQSPSKTSVATIDFPSLDVCYKRRARKQ